MNECAREDQKRDMDFEHFKQTREIQWKVNIALWTLFSLLMYSGYSVERDEPLSLRTVLPPVLLWTGLHVWWLCRIQDSLDRSKQGWRGPEEGACKKLGRDWKSWIPRSWQWIVIQGAVTLVFACTSACVLNRHPKLELHRKNLDWATLTEELDSLRHQLSAIQSAVVIHVKRESGAPSGE